ncbi:unnamed protein product, partial [Meganyctiphanes norvegica]
MLKSLDSPCGDRMYKASYGTPDSRQQSCKLSPRQFKFATPQQVLRSPGCVWSPAVNKKTLGPESPVTGTLPATRSPALNKKSLGPESYESPVTGTIPAISLWAPRKENKLNRTGNPPYCRRSLIR